MAPTTGSSTVAIVGGTGLDALDGLDIVERRIVQTPYGEPAAPLTFGRLHGQAVCFLPRHGDSHGLPPHRINYRANMWALRDAGVEEVIAVAAVGGISSSLTPGDIVIPSQIIDYTWGRDHTFHEPPGAVEHIDFTVPYTLETRKKLIAAGRAADVPLVDDGVYGATQGPRLETAAEIDRMERDGCTIVGMTGMPEAGLAREAGLRYAACALVVNPAAGRAEGEITMDDIREVIKTGMDAVHRLLHEVLQRAPHHLAHHTLDTSNG